MVYQAPLVEVSIVDLTVDSASLAEAEVYQEVMEVRQEALQD